MSLETKEKIKKIAIRVGAGLVAIAVVALIVWDIHNRYTQMIDYLKIQHNKYLEEQPMKNTNDTGDTLSE